jgi:hypothetical protein
VLIDDVEGDTEDESWCSDASGCIDRLGRDSNGAWRCAWRSDGLCADPGFYDNLHPIKGEGGVTVKLAVPAPGYVFRFEVDAGRIAIGWWSSP